MGFRKLFCPSCGASIELDESREFGFCVYCGTKIAQDKLIVEHRGNVSVSGVADTNAILERARMYLEDRKFDYAFKYCERALDLNPKNADAYFLKLMAETRSQKREDLGKSVKPLNAYDSFLKAMRFGTQKMKEELTLYKVQSTENFTQEIQCRQDEIDQKKKALEDQEALLTQLEKIADRNHVWISCKGLFIVLAIIVNVALTILGAFTRNSLFTVIVYLLLIVATVVEIIVLNRMEKRALKHRANVLACREEVHGFEREIEEMNKEMQSWIEQMENKI